MSLNETSALIAESRKIIDSGQDSSDNVLLSLNMILRIVTNIDDRMKKMESNIDKRIDDLKQTMLSVSARVRTLENFTDELSKKVNECESSCEGVSNLFDKVDRQIKLNTRNLIHQDIRIKKLEQRPASQPDIQHVNESEEIASLRECVLDLQCRSMKNNLIFTGLARDRNEDTEELLRYFLHEELGIDYRIEFGNVHRFNTRKKRHRPPIVARFLYHKDLEFVLKNAYKLKGKPFGIKEQFPREIEERRRFLYPVVKKAKQENRQVALVRDKLYVDNVLYEPNVQQVEPVGNPTTPRQPPASTETDSPEGITPPSKRQRRKEPSPRQGGD